MGTTLTEIEAAIKVRMSPTLLRWFTSYAPKYGVTKKLRFTEKNGEYFYDSDELDSFNEFLSTPWPCPPGQTRPLVPIGIKNEIVSEANHKCAFCEYVANGEVAHIDPVSKSGCNHPHNLIWSCPSHHKEYDHGLKVKSIIKPDHVRVIKEVLQDKQLRHWRIEFRAVATLLSLIEGLERIMAHLKDSKLSDIHDSLQAQARDVLRMVREEAAKPAAKKAKSAANVSTKYQGFLDQIGKIIPVPGTVPAGALNEVVEEVVEATEGYLRSEALVKCPLCKGSGVHNRFTCRICVGEGTVLADRLSEIDLLPYKQVNCPLCDGTGTHNRLDCPVCFDVGTVDEAALNEIDLTPFEQTNCPICKGSGVHNRLDCPFCLGVGTIDRRDDREIDLSPFEQTECPLCKGKKTRKGGFECEMCLGVGTIDQRSGDVDLSPFEQVECSLCKGSKRYKGDECPVCRGEGEIDRRYADNLDLNAFSD